MRDLQRGGALWLCQTELIKIGRPSASLYLTAVDSPIPMKGGSGSETTQWAEGVDCRDS